MNALAECDFDNLERIDLSQVKLDPAWSHAIPASGARRYKVIGLCRLGDEVIVATCNKRVDVVHEYVASQLRTPFRLVAADESSLRRLLSQVYPPRTPANRLEEVAEACETVAVCNQLLRAAFLRNASDIHVLPSATTCLMRFRVDGILEDYKTFPIELHAGLVSRIKVLAEMDIAEKREPQDGRFSIQAPPSGQTADIRAATIPTRFGERVTLRLLPPTQGPPNLSKLGMDDSEFDIFSRAISNSNGLILLTGPTGCGKSTTLYTAISHLLQSRSRNVITIEDPIEYEIPGASQVEVDSADKVSFSRALRSILRHDPDVIMLGEIRDAETAELAIKAALTGHLVFSTLHTNTAAGVVTRLTDMGVEPFLVAATLRLAVAQRLVRRLCSSCKTRTTLGASEAKALRDSEIDGREAYEGNGCVYCAGRGFAGRAALFEMLPVGGEVSDLISQGATEAQLLEHMRQQGHPMLDKSGVNKVLAGTTTVNQVLGTITAW